MALVLLWATATARNERSPEEQNVFEKWKVAVLLSLSVLLACGGYANRRTLVHPTTDGASMLEALHLVAIDRGLRVQFREERQVAVTLDAQTRTRVYFQAKRRGISMLVRAQSGEEVDPAWTEAELARAETLGQDLMAAALLRHEELERQRHEQAVRQAELERIEAERDAAEAAQRAAERAEMDQRMQGFRARREERRQRRAGVQRQGEQPGQTRSGAHCCVNGSYYECPGAAEVDRCVGEFTRCMSSRGFDGMESCLQDHPPDPSGCRRVSSRDGEC